MQDANMRVCATPDSIGNVRTRDPSKLIEAELLEVEDHCEDQDTKFQSETKELKQAY